MSVIGLTGGIACGKSLVSSILQEFGAYVIDTDKIAHNIMQYGKPAWIAIVNHFDSQILRQDNSINRTVLADKIFSDSQERKILEQIMHPLIKEVVQNEIEYARCNNYDMVVVEAPLLFEANWVDIADQIWVVYVEEGEQVNRLILRDHITVRQAMSRIKSQISLSDKVALADVVINNNGSIIDTKKQVLAAWNYINSVKA